MIFKTGKLAGILFLAPRKKQYSSRMTSSIINLWTTLRPSSQQQEEWGSYARLLDLDWVKAAKIEINTNGSATTAMEKILSNDYRITQFTEDKDSPYYLAIVSMELRRFLLTPHPEFRSISRRFPTIMYLMTCKDQLRIKAELMLDDSFIRESLLRECQGKQEEDIMDLLAEGITKVFGEHHPRYLVMAQYDLDIPY